MNNETTSKNNKNNSTPAIQFYAELRGFKPKLWRRFLVCSDAKMSTLAYALLSMFKASGGHLFKFETTLTEFYRDYSMKMSKSMSSQNIDEDSFFSIIEKNSPSTMIEFPSPDGFQYDNLKRINPKKIKVGEAFEDITTKCIFSYDFGDGWEFNLKAEEIKENGSGLSVRNPVFVLDGKNYGIIDDCGGIGGLANLIEVFKEKSGKEYEELRDWLGEDDFDFSEFDLAEINLSLKDDLKCFKSNYEDNPW